jgi:hypothetical protein
MTFLSPPRRPNFFRWVTMASFRSLLQVFNVSWISPCGLFRITISFWYYESF